MKLEEAIERAHAIQADVDAGRLTMPYPEPIGRELAGLVDVFSAQCQTSEQARELVQQISSSATAELPW